MLEYLYIGEYEQLRPDSTRQQDYLVHYLYLNPTNVDLFGTGGFYRSDTGYQLAALTPPQGVQFLAATHDDEYVLLCSDGLQYNLQFEASGFIPGTYKMGYQSVIKLRTTSPVPVARFTAQGLISHIRTSILRCCRCKLRYGSQHFAHLP